MIALESLSLIEMKRIIYNFETINSSIHIYYDFFSCFSEYYLLQKLWTHFFLFYSACEVYY